MKTKQEQIEKIQEIINNCYEVDSYIAAEGSEGGYIDTEEAAKAIVEAGYGDVSEYKAEREMLGSQIKVLKQRLNNKYVEIEQLKYEFKRWSKNPEKNQRKIAWAEKDIRSLERCIRWIEDLEQKFAKYVELNRGKDEEVWLW